jgi:NADPH2 dehydrogenase
MTKLFTPIKVGRMELAHRIAMAPMTRYRADDQHVPLPFVKEYYAQRTAVPGSLAITEATFITANAGGYPNVPGIYTQDQIAAWREVTEAVHKQGSHIFMQLWALGRSANPNVLKEEGGFDLVSASDIPMGPDAPAPRPLTEQEIQQYIADYVQAAKNAIAAGFDGVEIHNANGYLLDQFLQDVSNNRTDAWGGSIEKRARFPLEVVKAISAAIGSDRVGIRLSPYSSFQGMRMADPIPQFTYIVEQLKQSKLAYLHVVESRIAGNADVENSGQLDFILDAYDHASPVVIAGGYKFASSKDAVDSEYKDYDVVIAIGRPYTANPDLPFRFKEGIDLKPYERDAFYVPKSSKGYNDYPFSEQFTQIKAKA